MSVAASTVLPARTFDLPAMFKEAGLTAVVLFLLTVGLVGFDIHDVSGGIELQTRFSDVAIVTAIGFLGRLLLILQRQGHFRLVIAISAPLAAILLILLLSETIGAALGSDAVARLGHAVLPFHDPLVSWVVWLLLVGILFRAANAIRHAGHDLLDPKEREARMDRVAARVQRAAGLFGPVLLVVAIALPFLPFSNRQIIDVATLVLTYVMLGWGLNIVVGLAGLLDLGYVAFYAVGAYSYALFAQDMNLGFWACLPFAGLMSATAGVMLGFPVLRLRGDYLAIVTLGFGEMIRIILTNWVSFTNGPNGVSGIPRPSFFGLPFSSDAAPGVPTFFSVFHLTYTPIARVIFLYYLILALALVTNLFTLRIRKLPIGRAWEALREDETACRSLGINPRNTKLTAFGIGAMFAGFAGSFFATRQGFVSPESFSFIESAVILAIVVLGGMGSQIGVVFAAILLIGLPEFFRELHQYRMLAFGAAMVLIMLWRPSGLLAHREPTLRLYPHTRNGRNGANRETARA
jgi:branched-chain amino acid transport system permease protein